MKTMMGKSTLALWVTTLCCADGQPAWVFRPTDTLAKTKDCLLGRVAAALSDVPYWIPSVFKNPHEGLLFKLSEIRAKRVFWNAYNTVPAYRDFVDKQCEHVPARFSDIPVMSKKNYIEQYRLEQTIKYGKIPLEGYMDPSSGTSGRRTLWIRGNDEIKNTQKTMDFVRAMFLGNEQYVLINMFLPSAWTLGLMRGLGPNVAEAYETMKDLGMKPKYLIMGHTSLIKYFVQHCPFDLTAYDVTLLIGGEHMSRALYQFFIQRGIKKVYAGYGASDLNFTVGIQEEFARALQDLCLADPAFKKDLTGSEQGLPYFFHYSPVFDYIEEVNGHLVLTDLDHTRISPRVRYDVGDRGKILKISFVQEVLKKHGINLKPETKLPLICLYGRVEHTIMFGSAELAFDDLELAILAVPELVGAMNQYAYNRIDESNQLEFWIELKEGLDPASFDTHLLRQKVCAALAALNSDFKRELGRVSAAPVLKVYTYKKSPMLEESAVRKAKYLYHISNS